MLMLLLIFAVTIVNGHDVEMDIRTLGQSDTDLSKIEQSFYRYTVELGRNLNGKLEYGQRCDYLFNKPKATTQINFKYRSMFNTTEPLGPIVSDLLCNKEKFLFCDHGNYTKDDLGFVTYSPTCQCVKFQEFRDYKKTNLIYDNKTKKCRYRVNAHCDPFNTSMLIKDACNLYSSYFENDKFNVSCSEMTECRILMDVLHKRSSLVPGRNRCRCLMGYSVDEDRVTCVQTPKEIEIKGIIAIGFVIATFITFFGYVVYQERGGRYEGWSHRKPHS